MVFFFSLLSPPPPPRRPTGDFFGSVNNFCLQRFWLCPQDSCKFLIFVFCFFALNSKPSHTSDDVTTKTEKACSCKISGSHFFFFWSLLFFLIRWCLKGGKRQRRFGKISNNKAQTAGDRSLYLLNRKSPFGFLKKNKKKHPKTQRLSYSDT